MSAISDQKIGILLVNLGTPDSPAVSDVRRYLAEFLSDPRVIDINPVLRWLLLHGIILRFRPKKSAKAYASVWRDDGSPLMAHSKALAAKVTPLFGPQFHVELAMRYGNPNLKSAMQNMEKNDVSKIMVVPLFPQYASASSGSVHERVMDLNSEMWNTIPLHFVGAFYNNPLFLDAYAHVARPQLEDFKPDIVLLSYHGLPERHVKKSDTTSMHCLKVDNCCETMCAANRHCYKAQARQTTKQLILRLGLDPSKTFESFQSRLGRDPWIKPDTEDILTDLAKQGFKRVAVMCPAFVADCLETVEEINDRAQEVWIEAGGAELRLITSLNGTDVWAQALAGIIRQELGSVGA